MFFPVELQSSILGPYESRIHHFPAFWRKLLDAKNILAIDMKSSANISPFPPKSSDLSLTRATAAF